jgi:hypothetical protein
MEVKRDRITFWFGKLTFEVYWIDFQWSKTTKGFFAPTMLLYRPNKSWEWQWAVVARVLGFGFGLSWMHVSNPNIKKESK